MRKHFSRFVLAASLSLVLALTFSCGEHSGGGGGPESITKDKIIGTAQKGPFVKGSTVNIYELNANFEKPNNPSFVGQTKDDNGNFEVEITGGKLSSQYIVIEVKGKYINEVTGKPSDSEITLNATSNVAEKSDVNVNVLTHLEQERVLKLAQEGTSFEAAKKQAQGEVLSALGIDAAVTKNSEDINIFGQSASDSVLLLASIVLQANRTTDDVSSLLANFGEEIKESGHLSVAVRTEIEFGAASINMEEVKSNIKDLDPTAKVPDEVPTTIPVVTPPGSGLYCKWVDSDCPNKCCPLETPDAKDPGDNDFTYKEACIEWSDGLFTNSTCIGTPIAGGFNGEYCKWEEGGECYRLANPDGPDSYAPGLTIRQNCLQNSEFGIFNDPACTNRIAGAEFNYCKTSHWEGCTNGCCKFNANSSYINDEGVRRTAREDCIQWEDGVYDNPTCTGTPIAAWVGEYCKSANLGVDCPNACCRLVTPDRKPPEEGGTITERELCIKYDLGVYNNSTCSGTPVVVGGFIGKYCKTTDPSCPTGCCPLRAEQDMYWCTEHDLGVYGNSSCTGTVIIPPPINDGIYCKFSPGVEPCPNDCCVIPPPQDLVQIGITKEEWIADCNQNKLGVFNNPECR